MEEVNTLIILFPHISQTMPQFIKILCIHSGTEWVLLNVRIDILFKLLYLLCLKLLFLIPFGLATYRINLLPFPSLHNMSPFQIIHHHPSDYSILKAFSCDCYPLLTPYNSTKLQPKSTQCVFLGYPLDYKGYLCYNMSNGKIYTSRHALFDETLFPFTCTSVNQSPSITIFPSIYIL